MNSLITANKISVIKQGKDILKDVSLIVNKNDFITIVGPNGAGKSMLLKCLIGFYKPDKGNINKKNNLKIGYMPQKIHLDNSIPISVERFLTLGNNINKETLHNAIIATSVQDILTTQLSVLSGGQLQKVLLTRALLTNPDLLILDEPAQNLDISGQLSFYKLLEKIYQEHKISVLMVSHDLHMVMASTKQVVCLFHHICCSGEPHTVTQDPEFISLFGNDMAKMMAVYQHSHNHKHNDK